LGSQDWLPGSAAASHHVKKLAVGLGGAHLFEHHFHGLYLVHAVQELPQDAGFLQYFGLQQKFIATGSAAIELDGWENALLVKAAVQMDFRVTGALELFKDHLVHAAAGVDQGGSDDGQRSAFFHIACCAQKTLGPLQRIGIDAAG